MESSRERTRWHIFAPLFRAAICPPNSSAGSKNENTFIFPARHAAHAQWCCFLSPTRRDLASDTWAPYRRSRSTSCFLPFSVQFSYLSIASVLVYTGTNDLTTSVQPRAGPLPSRRSIKPNTKQSSGTRGLAFISYGLLNSCPKALCRSFMSMQFLDSTPQISNAAPRIWSSGPAYP